VTATINVTVGDSLEADAAAFVDAFEGAAQGVALPPSRLLSFESWEGLTTLLSDQKLRLLRHLRQHPEPSISALAQSLGEPARRVESDVEAMEKVGFIERGPHGLRVTADQLIVTIEF
jgi:predicted transcriptional regulator